MTIHRKASRRVFRRGASIIELALTLPILLLLTFGCYEFARANMIRHTVESAAYEGARVGIVPGATVADVEDAVGFILATVGVHDFEMVVEPNPITADAVTLRVDISLRMKDNSLIAPLFNEESSLTGACQLTREGN